MEDLTPETITQLCIMLRIIDLFEKNLDKIEKVQDLKKEYRRLKSTVSEIMRNLSEEQRDKVLEIHKKQMQALKSKQ